MQMSPQYMQFFAVNEKLSRPEYYVYSTFYITSKSFSFLWLVQYIYTFTGIYTIYC